MKKIKHLTKASTNKNMKTKSNTIRQARPLGLTLLASQVHKERTSDALISDISIERILSYILSNQISIDNKPLNLQTLSQYLQIPFTQVMKVFLKLNEKASNTLFPDKENRAGALIFFTLQNFLSTKAQIGLQVNTLMQSQGGQYKSFISDSVNNILKIDMDSNKMLLDIAKAMNGGNGISINNNIQNNNHNGPVSSIKSIGVNEALNLLQSEGLMELTYNPANYAGIAKVHQLDAAPEVRANLQSGNKEDAQYMVDKDNKKHHRTRREKDEDIDTEDAL